MDDFECKNIDDVKPSIQFVQSPMTDALAGKLCTLEPKPPISTSKGDTGRKPINYNNQLQGAWKVMTENWEFHDDFTMKISALIIAQNDFKKTQFSLSLLDWKDEHIQSELSKLPDTAAKEALRRSLHVTVDLKKTDKIHAKERFSRSRFTRSIILLPVNLG